MTSEPPLHSAIVVPSLEPGGAEKVALTLASEFAKRGIRVDLVLGVAKGAYLEKVPDNVRVIQLGQEKFSKNLIGLIRYMRREKPTVILSHMTHTNLVCGAAKWISRSRAKFFPVEHTPLSFFLRDFSTSFTRKIIVLSLRTLYSFAEKVIVVSDGIGRDLSRWIPSISSRIERIYNPVVGSREVTNGFPFRHAWVDQGRPFVLAIGRLSSEKNFGFLIDTLGPLLQERDLKLLIFGEGRQRRFLEEKVKHQGLENYIALPGFISNVAQVLGKAKVLVMSSLYEGLPTVIIEALACGTQVVSTDCVTGPREILDNGRFGELVPEENSEKFREAVGRVLDEPRPTEFLLARSRDFGVITSVTRYLQVFGATDEEIQ